MKPVDNQRTLLSDLLLLKGILVRVGMRPAGFFLPVALALGVALLEGLSVWLLVSFAKGAVAMDFSFVKDMAALSWALPLLPVRLAASNSFWFMALVSLVFLTFLLKNAAQYGASVSVAFLVRKAGNSMRKLLAERYMSFGKLYFDRTSAGHLHSVLMNFTDKVASKLVDLQQFFTSTFMLLAYLGMMCYISWKLTAFVMVFFPVMNYFQISLIQRIRETSASQVSAQAEMSRKLFNILSGILLVKAYGTEAKELAVFSATSDQIEEHEYSIDKKASSIVPIQEVIVLALLLSLLSAMALIISRDGASQLPAFLVYFYVIRRAAASFGILSQLKATLASISGPLAEVLEMLHDGGKHFVPAGTETFPGLKSRIDFADLRFSYVDGTPVFKGVTFSIEKGKVTAIVGPSGTGKTTLINLLARFYESPPGSILIDGTDIGGLAPDSLRAHMALVGPSGAGKSTVASLLCRLYDVSAGRIAIDGTDIRDLTLTSLRRQIAVVAQETYLFDESVRANIAYGLNGALSAERLDEAVRKARLGDFVSRLPAGLDTNIGDRGVQLSGGEKQRVSIARAMLKRAEIMILDEATSSLDSGTERLIQEAINDMVAGKTAIVIAHRLSTIKKADKIVVLEEGRVAEEGTLTELLSKKGRFHRYWEDQKFY